MEKFKGIIINLSKYKNYDVVINVLTNDGLFSVIGRGSFKNSSKTNFIIHPFLYGEFEVYKGPVGGYKLKDCKVIEFFDKYFESYEDHVFAQFITELTFKMTVENSDLSGCFDDLLAFLNKYKVSENKYSLICYYFALILKRNGVFLNLDNCVDCGNNTNIVGIDFEKGGAVCTNHFSTTTKMMNEKEFSVYASLFHYDLVTIDQLVLSKEEFKEIISNLSFILEKNFNLNIKTLSLINTV